MSHHYHSRQRSSGKSRKSSHHPSILDNLDDPQGRRYKEIDLSSAVKQHADTFWSEIDTRLKSWEIAALRGDIPHVTSQHDFLQLAKKWARIFDHAFFFNLARKGLRKPDPIVMYHDDQEGVHGFVLPTDRPFISLNMHSAIDDGSPGCAARHMIGTLLHEMLHAFLVIYTCQCKRCENVAVYGGTGARKHIHGPPWINAMIPLERALQSQVRWKVEACTYDSVGKEIVETGWAPRDDQLRGWGVDPEYLRRSMSLAPESKNKRAFLGQSGYTNMPGMQVMQGIQGMQGMEAVEAVECEAGELEGMEGMEAVEAVEYESEDEERGHDSQEEGVEFMGRRVICLCNIM